MTESALPAQPMDTTPHSPEPAAPPSAPESSSQPQSPQTPPAQTANLPEDNRPQPEQLVLEWKSAARPFKKRNRQYYVTVAMIVFLIALILFFAGQFLPIAVVIAGGFLAYVFSAVPPEIVTHQITTYGIRSDQTLYYWDELGRFWYSTKYGQRLLHIEVARFPNQLTFLLGDVSEEDLTDILSRVLLQEKPLPTSFEKAATWLQEKIPLDTEA